MAVIEPAVATNQVIGNTTTDFALGAANKEFSFFFDFAPISDTGGGTEFLIRLGSSTANDPAIGLRHRSALNDYVVYIDTPSGTVSCNIGDLTNGHRYRICVCVQGSGLSGTDHPDRTAGTEVIVYVYETFDGTSFVRTPTPAIQSFDDASGWINSAGLSTRTGILIAAQVNYTTFGVSNLMWFAGDALTKVICDHFGQRTRHPLALGVTPTNYWPLHLYPASAVAAEQVMSASPTGYEAWHLSDAVGAIDLAATGTVLPRWSQDTCMQRLPTSEDTVQLLDFDDEPSLRNLARAREVLDLALAGFIAYKLGDSIHREGSARYGLKHAKWLLENGYEIGSLVCHWRTSFLPVKITWPAGVTKETYCNGDVAASFASAPLPDATHRYGVFCGGICEITGGTLGTNNRCMTLEVTNDIQGQTWFADGDRIKARVSVFISNDADQSADVLRCVGAGSTVDLDPASLTDFRKQAEDGATWAQIEAGGGAAVLNRLTAAYVLVDCGTSGTTRSVEFRLPGGLTAGKKWRIGNVQWIKCDAGGDPLVGPGIAHFVDCLHDSASFIDFHTSAENTTSASKRNDDDRLGRYLSMWTIDPAMDALVIHLVQTENKSKATTQTNVGLLKTRFDGLFATAAWEGDVRYLLVSHITNNVDDDSVVADRQHCIDTRDAFRDFADANASSVAHFSFFDMTRGHLLDSTEHVYGGYTQLGIGESEQVALDATLLAAIGGSAECLDAAILHPAVDAFATAMVSAMWDAIAAASISTGGSPGEHGDIGSVDTMALGLDEDLA